MKAISAGDLLFLSGRYAIIFIPVYDFFAKNNSYISCDSLVMVLNEIPIKMYSYFYYKCLYGAKVYLIHERFLSLK